MDMFGRSNSKLHVSLFASAAITGTMLLSPAAFAQAQTDTPAGAEAVPTTDDGGLAEITVTARKVGENLVDTPVAITALTAEALNARGVQGFQELNDFVPGLRYQNSAANRNDRSFNTYSMRGMYPGDSPNRQAVTVFVDGVPVPAGSIPGMTDVQRVEVVKGPQSAYFGRSTFAGAINFITAPPSLTDFGGSLDVSADLYATVNVKASIEGPIIANKIGVRLSGTYYSTDGQYRNAGFGGRLGERETKSVAGSLIIKPFETLTVRAYGTYWRDSDGATAQALLGESDYNCNIGGTGRIPTGSTTGFNTICGNLGDIPTSKMSQNTRVKGNNNFGGVTNPPSGAVLPADFIDNLGLEREAYQAYGMFDWELGDYTLSGSVSNSGNNWSVLTDTYNRADTTGYSSTVLLPYNIDNTSAELRVATPNYGPLSFLVGGNYYWESINFFTRAYRPTTSPLPTNLGVPTDYRARTWGIFGAANLKITDSLKLSGEARYQWDTINHIAYSATTNAVVTDLSQTFRSFSPRVILNYQVAPSISTYLSWSKGTRPGTFNTNYVAFSPAIQAQLAANAPGGSVPVAVPEEKLTMYEFGFKGEMFDRKLRVLSAFYYGQWRDRQINQNVPYTIGGTTSTATLTFPNGSTNLYGVELETTFKPSRAWTFEGTFNWAKTDIRFTDCSECVQDSGVRNPVGNLMERYPEFSGSAAATYEQPLDDVWTGSVRVDYIYTGKQYATAANTAWIDSASRINLRVGIQSEHYTFEIFGRNLTDDKTPSNILRNTNPNNSAAQGLNTFVLAAPERRTVGMRGVARF
jgi:iron complex outermembrane receptor protein